MSFEVGSRRERPAEDELARGEGLLSFDLSSHDLRVPSPHATSTPFVSAATIVPGGPSDRNDGSENREKRAANAPGQGVMPRAWS
jgi:hypothetical protein